MLYIKNLNIYPAKSFIFLKFLITKNKTNATIIPIAMLFIILLKNIFNILSQYE